MTNVREIKDRMGSINDIMKITNAMYLISSSKLKKAKKSLEATVPYFDQLQSTIHHILKHTPEFEHVYFDSRSNKPEDKKTYGYIVVTGDKGLCGSYNHNVLKLAEQEMSKHKNTSLFIIGQVGRQYFSRRKVMIDGEFLYTAQNPTLYRARSIAESLTDLYLNEALDEIYVIFTKMITAAKMEPEVIRLLPMERERFKTAAGRTPHHDAVFSPSPEKVMDHLVPNYLKGLLYGVLIEAFSSEQNARMTAMDSATSSAKDMIKELNLLYNRARQAAITQEITEIVSGAKSQQNKKN